MRWKANRLCCVTASALDTPGWSAGGFGGLSLIDFLGGFRLTGSARGFGSGGLANVAAVGFLLAAGLPFAAETP
jgi:hypothetical protein